MIWWMMAGALSHPTREDVRRTKWCVETLRRGLLSDERLAEEDPLRDLDITVTEPEPASH
jgi:hypothetical protein